jgi:hypothetical protein
MSIRPTGILIAALTLAAASMESCAAGAVDPAPKPPMVGGPCSYATQPGRLVVTAVDRQPGQIPMVHFQFRPAGQDQPDGAALETTFATAAPLPGQSLPGRRETETHGTCTPLVYFAVMGGAPVRLTIAAWPKQPAP